MTDKIIHSATPLFMKLGFKSVTMDDLAQEVGISKKTLYQHFESKDILIKEVLDHIIQSVDLEIERIQSLQLNPIDELLTIRESIHKIVPEKGEDICMFQLQRYYPSIFKYFQKEVFGRCYSKISHNLKNGIREGVYREEIDIELYSEFYYHSMMNLNSEERLNCGLSEWRNQFILFFLRGVLTTKGQTIFNQLLQKNTKEQLV